MNIRELVLLGSLVILIVIVIETIQTRRLIAIGIGLANDAEAFQKSGSEKRILVIGDSTAVGTGASSSSTSLAGLLSLHFPKAVIENRGINGARTAELIPRLQNLQNNSFDLVMIHIGGNDTVHFTNLSQLSNDIRNVIDLTKNLSNNVVLVSTGNVGTARLLPFGTRWLFAARTRKVRDRFIQASQEKNIQYVDLYRAPAIDPFAIDPDTYYAKDQFHPSDAGYADWFSLIKKQLPTL